MDYNSNEDHFTASQVMTMFESLRNDISVIAEGQISMKEDINILKSDVGQLKFDMTIVKDFIRIEFSALKSRVSILEKKVG